MAKHHKSDDSGDSDYDPEREKNTKMAPSTRKAGASKSRSLLSFFLPNGRHSSKALLLTFISLDQGTLPTPGPTPTDPTFAAAQLATYHRQAAHHYHHSQHPSVPLQSPLPAVLLPPMPAVALRGMLQHDDEVLRAQLNFSRRGLVGHCSRDTADIW
jgi:hypothetical protein